MSITSSETSRSTKTKSSLSGSDDELLLDLAGASYTTPITSLDNTAATVTMSRRSTSTGGTILVTNTAHRFIRIQPTSSGESEEATEDLLLSSNHNIPSSLIPPIIKTKISEQPTTNSGGSRFFGIHAHRSISQESFNLPVNTIFSAKGQKGRAILEKSIVGNSPNMLHPQQIKSKSLAFVVNNENRPRKRYSYPLLSGYETEIPGICRLPLSPVKAKQPRIEASRASATSKSSITPPNFVKGQEKVIPRVHASLHDDKSPEFDIYDPGNSIVETFSPSCFTIQRNRILRKLEKKTEETSLFSVLPDEMVLKIFKFLPKMGLFNCALVSHRFHDLADDETLWRRMDVIGRTLSQESIKIILSRCPVYLRLARSLVPYPLGLPDEFMTPQLLYLDLSMVEIGPRTLSRILSMCPSLVKCSLEALCVNSDVLRAMLVFSSTIDTLNLTLCYDLNYHVLLHFLSRSTKLKSLNLGCVQQSWTTEELFIVVSCLPSTLEYLNMSGFVHRIHDEHVKYLVKRLPQLKELDVSDSQQITQKGLEYIIEGLKKLESLGLSRCYSIQTSAYLNLASAPLLRTVQLFSLFKEQTMLELQASLSSITFNGQPCSTIARPTVGNRRSTIWDQRVRD